MARTGSRPEPRDTEVGAGGGWPVIAGGLCLVWAAASVGLLAAERLAGLSLPGCGGGGGCAAAASGPWGSIPGLGWPVSYVGLAYYAAAGVAWVWTRGRPGRWGLWIVRAGAAFSAVYLGVMLLEGILCPYCVSAHAGGLSFWLIAEWTARRAGASPPAPPPPPLRFAVATALCFVLGTGALAAAEFGGRRAAATRAERDLSATTARLSAGSADAAGFAGRYVMGPADARVRVVVFTDYQCPDCRRVEGELRAALAATSEANLSIKHFPFCTECNPTAPNLHPNACRAAMAAEAAGTLGGAEGFGRMHHWLFDRGGVFTEAELVTALPALGFDADRFARAMKSAATWARIREDIDEAFGLGLASTPLIYINGVEVRGWNAPDGVGRAIRAALEAAPAAAGSAADRPASAREKHLADWREGARLEIAADAHPRSLGPEGALVRVVVYGDYQEPFTAQADASVRALVKSRGDVRYEFRHFPVDQSCNPVAPRTMHAAACLAARAAEVGAFVKGPESFWAIHEWLMGRNTALTAGDILAAAPVFGFAPDVFAQALEVEEIGLAVVDDISSGNAMGLTSIPLIIVNERIVPRWKFGAEDLLPAIVEEAARE